MPSEQFSSQVLRAMAAEYEAGAVAAEERARMHDRGAAVQPTDQRRHEYVMAAGKARDIVAFNRARAQALEDGARLLEQAERSAA